MVIVWILLAANVLALIFFIRNAKTREEEIKQIEEDYQELLKTGNDYPASMRKGK